MQLDWSTLIKTDNDFQVENPEEQSPEFNYTDSAAGVKLHADKGVLPDDDTANISVITSGSDYNTAKDNLSNFKLYSISVSADLNGKMQISLPIPSGVSEPIVYRISDGKKTKISGTSENGYFTFSIKEVGNYAIGGDTNELQLLQLRTMPPKPLFRKLEIQQENHYIVALIRDKVFQALRRLCPANSQHTFSKISVFWMKPFNTTTVKTV